MMNKAFHILPVLRLSALILLLFASPRLYAQEEQELELQLGDTLIFAACEGEAFTYIDLYVKTRFELDSISYDSIQEWAFYNRFFNTGDFDVSRLPCSYSGKKATIKHMMAIESAPDTWVNVVLVMIRDGKSVAYITEEAFLRGEVEFHSRP